MSPGGLGGGQTSTGGPLTDFRRGRRSLPLPSERVKIGSRHVGPWWVLGRALTDFRRRRRNPSASSGRVLPLPQARGRSAGRWGRGLGCVQAVGRMCSVFRRMCSVSGPMCSVSGRMCSLRRAMCSVFGGARPPSRAPLAGSEQALQGRRDDGGSGREAGVSAPWHVSTLSGQCVQFLGGCVHFRGECVHCGGRCVQFFGGAPWLEMGRGRKARFLGSAALRLE